MKRVFIAFIMLLMLFIGCQNEAAPSINVSGNTSPTPNIPNGNGGKITSLQAIIDDPETGDTIDCSLYNITDYNATVNKAVTIKNANMQGDTLKVTSGGVVLENVSKAAVNTNSSLKISGSSLSSLSIGEVTNGRGELMYSVGGRGDSAVKVELEGDTFVRSADLDLANASIVTDTTADIENIEVKKNGKIQGNAANIRIAGSKIKLEVTDLSADKVTFVGNNTTLDVMNKESSIKSVETDEDVVCQLEMEEGSYTNMNNPTVKGENGKLTRVDKTKDASLSNLSINQNPIKIAYSVDETLDITGLEIVETYRTEGIEEFTKDWIDGHLVETYTRLETAPLTNTAYSFTYKGEAAIGYKFTNEDKGTNTIVITKTEGETVISTEALKVVVLKDDEYAISYGGIDPQDITDYNLPRFYKKSNKIELETNLTKQGFVFAGWYEDNNKGPITGWEANTKEGSVSLYARWINMLYVDPDLTDDVGYGSYDVPFKTIERAIAAITSTGSYTIVLKKDITGKGYEKIDFKQNFPIKITIQPEIGTVSINEYEYLMFGNNIDLTLKNISFSGEIEAWEGKSLTLENVNIGNGIRCGQASFTNVTTLGDVFCTNAVFTDVTIDGSFSGTDISFNKVNVNRGAYFDQGTLTNVKIAGSVECNSAVFTDSEVGYVRCNGESTFKNVTIREGDLTAFADINLGGNLSFAGKIVLAASKKIVLTDSITTTNQIIIEIPSVSSQKFQIIDGRSEYVNANWNKFVIDGTAWYLKNGQLRRYWYVDGTNGDDNNLGSEDHPLKTVHKAVESATADSIIYVSADTSEDACMDIIYDTEIYPFGYVNDESWTGGHLVIQRNCFGDDYQKSFIKVHENAKLKARYFEFNGNGRVVLVPMSHAAGITVAGGDIDIKHCIISRFTSDFYDDDDDAVGCGGPGGLSLYNLNETEKTIILEDLTIDSCHGYTMALAVGNFGHDDGHLTVEIGNNVNITGGFWDITRAARPYTEYLPAVIRLDGKYSKLTLTKDIKLNTYFEDNNLQYNRNHLIDISAGVFTIDNCTLSLPEKPNNYSHTLVNGIYIHKMRTEWPDFYYNGNVTIESYDDVALTLEDEYTRLRPVSTYNTTLTFESKSNKKGTAIELIGTYHLAISLGYKNNANNICIFGFDTAIRYLRSEEYSSEYVPSSDVSLIKDCNVAIEVGNGTEVAKVKADTSFNYNKRTFESQSFVPTLVTKTRVSSNPVTYNYEKHNTYDVKFYNTAGNTLLLSGGSDNGITSICLDLQNKSTMEGVININNISGFPEHWITLDLTNDPNGNIVDVFTNIGSDTTEDIISKFNLITPGYSLVSGTDANHISIEKTN